MDNKERKIIVLLLLIIILIIIIFFIIGKFGIIDESKPTGYVDIFDINISLINNDENKNCCNCEGECSADCVCSCNGQTTSVETMSTTTTSTSGQNVNLAGENGVIVEDSEVQYSNKTKLNIFTHQSYYVADGVIAPGVQNSYQFIVRNNNEFDIIYNLKFEEDNPYNINMKYILKMNGKAVLGDENNWVTASELANYNIELSQKSYDVYTLEWKWFESDNDTEIGTDIDSGYELNISFYANEI